MRGPRARAACQETAGGRNSRVAGADLSLHGAGGLEHSGSFVTYDEAAQDDEISSANAAFFRGVDPWSPAAADLISWGANYGSFTTGGDPSRLLMSAFLVLGALQFVLNMVVLWNTGFVIERLVGSWGFLIAYLVSAFCGSVASIAWNPYVPALGASGAVFGVCGVVHIESEPGELGSRAVISTTNLTVPAKKTARSWGGRSMNHGHRTSDMMSVERRTPNRSNGRLLRPWSGCT